MIKKHDSLFSGILLIALAAIVFTQIPTIRITKMASDARLMPKITAVIMLILGVILIAEDVQKNRSAGAAGTAEKPVMKTDGMVRVVLCLLLFGGFIWLMPRAGFILSGIAYLVASFYLLAPPGKKNHVMILLTGVLVPVAVYFLFVKGFRLLLPQGAWFK